MADELYYDPYDFEIDADPYPIWKRLRDEAPLYYNEKYDFFAVSRFDDVERCSVDWRTYRSGRGSVLELIKQGVEIPPGSILFEDPPTHDVHRSLLSRRVHAAAHGRARTEGACVLRAEPRPARGLRRLRLHPRPRRADADAHDRHAARHPRERPGGDPRPDRRRTAHRRGRTARGGCGDGHERRRVRRLHRLAGRPSVRRPHDRPAPGGVRGSHGRAPSADAGGDPRLRRAHRGGGQRDHDPAHRVGGQGAGREPRPAGQGGRRPVAGERCGRGAPALRGAVTGTGALHPGRRGAPRAEDRGGQRHGAAHRGGQPRRAPLPGAPIASTSSATSTTTCRSGTASTSASAPRSLVWRAASRSTRCLQRFPEWEVDWDGAERAHTSTVRGWERLPVLVP